MVSFHSSRPGEMLPLRNAAYISHQEKYSPSMTLQRLHGLSFIPCIIYLQLSAAFPDLIFFNSLSLCVPVPACKGWIAGHGQYRGQRTTLYNYFYPNFHGFQDLIFRLLACVLFGKPVCNPRDRCFLLRGLDFCM